MININKYITEKLHVGAGMKSEISEDDLCVHPSDPEAEDVCKSFNTDEVMYCKYANGRNNAGKIKLMLGDGHFYIKPATAKSINDPLPDSPLVLQYAFKDLIKVGLSDSYVIDAYQSRIDRSSRINNLKRTYHYFYFGENGMIFKDKKEANTILKAAKQDFKLPGQYRYKIITIKDAFNMKGSAYGDSIEDIKFIQK